MLDAEEDQALKEDFEKRMKTYISEEQFEELVVNWIKDGALDRNRFNFIAPKWGQKPFSRLGWEVQRFSTKFSREPQFRNHVKTGGAAFLILTGLLIATHYATRDKKKKK